MDEKRSRQAERAIATSLLVLLGLAGGLTSVVNRVAAQESVRPSEARQAEPAKLEARHGVERPLTGGETHKFTFDLSERQFAKVSIDQRGIDVSVRLFSPENQKLAEIDSPNSSQGNEIVYAIANRGGLYKLEI